MSLDTGAPVDLSEELAERLRDVGRAVAPREIGELWIFPPLEDVEESAEFLLFTRIAEGERRRLYSARMGREGGPGSNGAGGDGAPDDAAAPPGGANGDRRQRITDHGSIPADRVPRLVERFRRRIEDEGHDPLHVVVEGTPERWRELLPSTNGRNGNGAGPEGNGTNPGGPGYAPDEEAGAAA
jgi:hypothetical protein